MEKSISELSIRSFWQLFALCIVHIINSFGYQCATRTYIFHMSVKRYTDVMNVNVSEKTS